MAFLLSACSNVSIGRRTASETGTIPVLDELLTFRASGKNPPPGFKFDDYKRNLSNQIYSLTHNKNAQIKFYLSDTLEDGVLFKIEPYIDDYNRPQMRVLQTQEALKDHFVVQELINFLNNVINSRAASTFTLQEIYINAKENDPTALRALATLRKHSLQDQFSLSINKTMENEYVLEGAKKWTEIETKLKKIELQTKKENKLLSEKRKALMDELDKAPESKQLRALIANGDRKGAADLISAYLPWEEMRPFEKHFWNTQLDIMRNPLPLSKRVMIFRGIQDDIIQTPIINGKKLELEEAIKEQNIFLMSTMMTKNQGSWNRRLRSLTSMNKKFMGTVKDDGVTEITEAARISTYLNKHAQQPVGSPFLSFTPDFSTAQTFGKQKVSVYLIDPRALTFNYSSMHSHEKEFLLPLATFPDDIAAVYVDGISPAVNGKTKEIWMQDLVLEKLMKEMGSAEGIETYKEILANTQSYFNHYQVYNTKTVEEKSALHAAELAKLPVIQGPKKFPSGGCHNILKEFWK